MHTHTGPGAWSVHIAFLTVRCLPVLHLLCSGHGPASAFRCRRATLLRWLRTEALLDSKRSFSASIAHHQKAPCSQAPHSDQKVLVDTSTVLLTYCSTRHARRSQYFKQRVTHLLGLDAARLSPRTAAAVLQFRTERGKVPPAGAPQLVLPAAQGRVAQLQISSIMPQTVSFVQVDVQTLGIRWTHRHWICLHQVKEVRRVRTFSKSYSGMKPLRAMLNSLSWGDSFATLPSLVRTRNSTGDSFATLPSLLRTRNSMECVDEGPEKAYGMQLKLARAKSSKSSVGSTANLTGTGSQKFGVDVIYSSGSGVQRALEVRMSKENHAADLAAGLQEMLRITPQHASAAHWRWLHSCMVATSKRGATGTLQRAELMDLLRSANASTSVSSASIEDILANLEQSASHLRLPQWLRMAVSGTHNTRELLSPHQLMVLLLKLGTCSQPIEELFRRFATNGRICLEGLLKFVEVEQIHGDLGRAELARAQVSFERAIKSISAESISAESATTEGTGTHPRVEEGLDLQQFALQLLSPQNDWVLASEEAANIKEKAAAGDPAKVLSEPLSHHWTACSHNTYIVGDQLTGISSADSYRRQLLQGCRHCEM